MINNLGSHEYNMKETIHMNLSLFSETDKYIVTSNNITTGQMPFIKPQVML